MICGVVGATAQRVTTFFFLFLLLRNDSVVCRNPCSTSRNARSSSVGYNEVQDEWCVLRPRQMRCALYTGKVATPGSGENTLFGLRRTSMVLGVTTDRIPFGGVRTTHVWGRPVKMGGLLPIEVGHVHAFHDAQVATECVLFAINTTRISQGAVRTASSGSACEDGPAPSNAGR